ncbi:MAG: phytoene desaturase family protein [Actinomycetes bacterium]
MTRTIVIGAGHNGLVAAVLLARAGRDVLVLERDTVVGGACRTEHPFARVPGLGASTGAYLLGLTPPELLDQLGLELPLRRREPHYFLPTLDGTSVLLGGDPDENRRQLSHVADAADLDALDRMDTELSALREDLAGSWLAPATDVATTAARWVRAELRDTYVDLVSGSVRAYLDRVGLRSPVLRAMYAVTDAFPGLHGGLDTPGSGHNFLVHNSGRLPGSGGTWMVVEGGMGTVTQRLAALATAAGAEVRTSAPAVAVHTRGGAEVTGVALADGTVLPVDEVVLACDPWRAVDLLGAEVVPDLAGRLDDWAARPGTTLKVNLALTDLPTFTALPERVGQHGATVHLLPAGDDAEAAVETAHAAAMAGDLPDDPPLEVYGHTVVDPSLQDAAGHHSAALFVQWVPNEPTAGAWDDVAPGYVEHLLGNAARYAPDLPGLVADVDVVHPAEIARRFGITGGNIFHVDNTFALTDRVPTHLGVGGVVAAGAGCHPAGSVIGAAGHNAARALLDA